MFYLFALDFGKETVMKKITLMVMAVCVILTAAACNKEKKEERSSTASNSASADLTEKTEQTEQTDEAATEELPTVSERQILDVNIQEQYEAYDVEQADGRIVTLAEFKYSAVQLSDEDAERYPDLAAVLEMDTAAQENFSRDDYNMLIQQAKENLAMGEEGFDTLTSSLDVQVRRADSTAFSVLYDSYYYNGMNGGARYFWGGNYDTETGIALYLPEVVTDMEGFAKVVEDKLFSTFGEEVFHSETIITEHFNEFGEFGTHWTLDYNGITVYFSEGEIADAGIGCLNVTVTFAENPELFNEKYTKAPDAYIVSLPTKSVFYTDLDGNGDCEDLVITDSYDEDAYVTAEIYSADNSYADSFPAYSCEPYYVKTADGKHYLYLFAEQETQMYLYVYDISDKTLNRIGEANVSPYYNDGISAVPTDPDRMHFDIFGDGAGGGISEEDALFSIGADGMPVQK